MREIADQTVEHAYLN